jgi:16S rRNA processing protein RimM
LAAESLEPYVTVARIRRPQGRRGEAAAELLTDFPERFRAGEILYLWKEGQDRREERLETAWLHKGGVILKFAGVDDISAAERLAGWEVQVPREGRRKLQGSAVYQSDLAGCRVLQRGRELGRIEAVDDRTGTPLLVVATAQGELLIPFAQEICRRVDVEAGVVEVELPEGLEDLNRDLRSGSGE